MSVKQDLIDLEELEKERMKEMGEENYYKWLESKFKVFACNIDTLSILRQVLNKAGYDFIEINTGQSIYLKTHLNKNDYDCIWWVIEDGQIYVHPGKIFNHPYTLNWFASIPSAYELP